MSLESRVELILKNILGEEHEVDPESRVEKLLQNLIEATYIVDPMSRVELLLENLQGGENEVIPQSRVEMLIANALGGTYDVTPQSRVEELLVLLAEQYATVYKTLTGAIVTFDDAVPDEPFKSLVVDINPVQDLHGYDSPWVGGGGKNLLNPSLLKDQAAWSIIPIKVKPSTVYTASTDKPSSNVLVAYFTTNNSGGGANSNNVNANQSVTITSTENGYVYFSQRRPSGEDSFSNYHFQVEEGSTATAYAPYENICPISGWEGCNLRHTGDGKNLLISDNGTLIPISWQTEAGTVYGGELDVLSGVMRVDKFLLINDGTLGSWNAGAGIPFWRRNPSSAQKPNYSKRAEVISNKYSKVTTGTSTDKAIRITSDNNGIYLYDSDFVDSETAISIMQATPVQIVYPLETPITYQLTPTEVNSLLGTNNLWADTGNTTVEYLAYANGG